MAVDKVWSEFPEPNTPTGKGRDCLYAAGLMALVHGGFAAFPLGAFTTAEREALERSDNRPDEEGANCGDLDVATSRRYRVTLRPLARSELAGALASPGPALVVTGLAGAFPVGLQLFGFTGAHAVCIVPLGDGKVRLLDPLRPTGYAGNVVASSIIVDFNRAGGAGFDCRIAAAGEFASIPAPAPGQTYTVRQGDTLSSIAAAHGTTWPVLWELNRELLAPRGPNFLLPGWVLRLTPAASGPAPTPPPAPKPARTYTVRQGDTLSAIAAAHGTTWPVLYNLNLSRLQARGPNYLRPGWVIKLP